MQTVEMKGKLEEKIKALEKEKSALLEEVKELKEVVELSEKANDLESEVNKLKKEVKTLKDKLPQELLQEISEFRSSIFKKNEGEEDEECSSCKEKLL
jgi:peptidoglycan hydrolase CwlO-like protein